MNTPQKLTQEMIVARMNIILKRFKQLPGFSKRTGIELPKSYDPERDGGFFATWERSSRICNLFQIGDITFAKDEVFGEKRCKYAAYAVKKCLALFSHALAIISSKTEFGIGGGLVVNDEIICAFSGRTPEEDEALVVILAYKCSWITNDRLNEIQKMNENPFLKGPILDYLLVG